MLKSLAPATAIALALGLQGCATAEAPFRNVDFGDVFSGPQAAVSGKSLNDQMDVAGAAMSAGDRTGAIRIYRHLARDYPLALEPRLKLGDALLRAGAAQEAALVYEGAVKLRPDSAAARAGLGRVEIALHQPAAALKDFNKAAQIGDADSQVQNGRAVALDQLGRHTDAQAIYLKLLDKDPSNQKLRSNYALSLALAGKYGDAADILTSLAQAPDAEPRIRENLAFVYGLAGNDGQAAHASRSDLDESAIHNNLEYYERLRNQNAELKSAPLSTPAAAPQLSSSAMNESSAQPSASVAETAAPVEEAPVTQASIAAPTSVVEANEAPAASPTPTKARNVSPAVVAPVSKRSQAAPAEPKARPAHAAAAAGVKPDHEAKAATTPKRAPTPVASVSATAKAVHLASLSATARVRSRAVPAVPPSTATDLATDLAPAAHSGSSGKPQSARPVAGRSEHADAAHSAGPKAKPHAKTASAVSARANTAEAQDANPLDGGPRLPAVL